MFQPSCAAGIPRPANPMIPERNRPLSQFSQNGNRKATDRASAPGSRCMQRIKNALDQRGALKSRPAFDSLAAMRQPQA
jgi:hypothetical protein